MHNNVFNTHSSPQISPNNLVELETIVHQTQKKKKTTETPQLRSHPKLTNPMVTRAKADIFKSKTYNTKKKTLSLEHPQVFLNL